MIKLFSIIILLLVCLEITSGRISTATESQNRPDILKIMAKIHNDLGKDWGKLKNAHLEMVAMLLSSYPEDQHFYFLAPDSSLIYDFARLGAQDNPKLLERIHLLHTSREKIRDPHFMDYLKQEGISEETLKAGRKVLFVNIGQGDSTHLDMAKKFSAQFTQQFQTHLLVSFNPKYPSSRVFLVPLVHEGNQPFVGGDSYFLGEEMTMPGSPLSRYKKQYTSPSSSDLSQKYREDLKAYFENNRERFKEKINFWKELREMTPENAVRKLKELMAKNPKNPLYEAMARDFMDMHNITLSPNRKPITLSDFGIVEIPFGLDNEETFYQSSRARYPTVAEFLRDDPTGKQQMLKLVREEKWSKLEEIFEIMFYQPETMALLAKVLGSEPLSPEGKAFIRKLIEEESGRFHSFLASHTFSERHSADPEMKNLLALLIENAHDNILDRLKNNITSSHTHRYMKGEDYRALREAIEMRDATQRREFLKKWKVANGPQCSTLPKWYQNVVGDAAKALSDIEN